VATPNDTSSTPIFWERLRDWMTDTGRGDGGDSDTGHSGIAITVCILVSLFLWFTLTLRDVHTDTVEVPLRVDDVPADEALVEYPPSTVRLQVRGEGFNLLRMRFNPPVVAVDGRQEQVDLSDIISDLGRDVQVESILPRSISLRKEPLRTARIPIQVRADLGTAATYELAAPPSVQPDSVSVAGAESIIEDLDAWPTERVERSNLRDSLAVRVALKDTLRGLVRKDRETTTLRAVAVAFTESVREVPVRVTGVPADVVSLDPSTVEVRYRVALDDYDEALQAEELFATVPYDEIRTDTTGFVRPRVNLPSGLQVRDVEVRPDRLRYFIALQ